MGEKNSARTKLRDVVSSHMEWGDLIIRAESEMLSTKCSDKILEYLTCPRERAAALGFPSETSTTWIDLAIQLVPGSTEEERDHDLPQLLKYHEAASTRMVSHLRTTTDAIKRTHWMAAGMLSKTSALAQASAIAFEDHLMRTAPQNRFEFDQGFMQDEIKMQQLAEFISTDPPLLLWRGFARFKDLFIF